MLSHFFRQMPFICLPRNYCVTPFLFIIALRQNPAARRTGTSLLSFKCINQVALMHLCMKKQAGKLQVTEIK